MRRAIMTCIVLLAGSPARGSTLEPATEPGASAPKLVMALPSYAPFDVTGLAWQRGQLYVGTNIGLLVVRDAAVERVLRWNPRDAVVEGPWLDRERDVLWLQEDATGALRSFDGQKWARLGLPEADFTRGDMLGGFRVVTGPGATWLVGASGAWTLDGRGKWQPMTDLPPGTGRLVWLWPAGANRFAARLPERERSEARRQAWLAELQGLSAEEVRKRTEAFARDPALVEGSAAVFTSDAAGPWKEVPDHTDRPFRPLRMARLGDGALACLSSGGVARITPSEIVRLDAPAGCEALASSRSGRVFGAFGDHGVYELVDGTWVRRFDAPARGEGERRIFLAVDEGAVAYAASARPSRPWKGREGAKQGLSAVWVTVGGTLKRVFPPDSP